MDSSSSQREGAATIGFDEQDLIKLSAWRMPFGRFDGTPLIDLPDEYLLWFQNRGGFPSGELGRLMQLSLEMRTNGTDSLVREIGRRANLDPQR